MALGMLNTKVLKISFSVNWYDFSSLRNKLHTFSEYIINNLATFILPTFCSVFPWLGPIAPFTTERYATHGFRELEYKRGG
jgi:hypothetical protein